MNSIVLSREFAVEMAKMFVGDLAGSEQIEWEQWKERPLLPSVMEWFCIYLPICYKHWVRSFYYAFSVLAYRE